MRLTCLRRTTFSRVLSAVLWNCAALLCGGVSAGGEPIPLPEHPRPDFQRANWLNLNGPWQFRFDAADAGLKEKWFEGKAPFPHTIMVPFPWGSPLSQVADEAPLAWYCARRCKCRRRGRASACSWSSARATGRRRPGWTARPLGTHRGGYTPFEFELTPHLKPGREAPPGAARGRPPAAVQARRQAGLRQRARHLADGLSRSAAGRLYLDVAPLLAGHRRAAR